MVDFVGQFLRNQLILGHLLRNWQIHDQCKVLQSVYEAGICCVGHSQTQLHNLC